MITFAKKLSILCGIVFGLAAFPVLAQQAEEVVINKKPLRDFGEIAKQKILNGEVDLDKEFLVSFVGVITSEGKLDFTPDKKTGKTKSRFTKSEGDAEMVELAKKAIEAIGDSGWLGYLRSQGIENFIISVLQDSEKFAVSVSSPLPTPEKARTVANGFSSVITMVLMMDRNNTRKLGDDERRLLSNTKVTAQEKNVMINFSLPKAEFKEMIQRQINNSESKTNG